MDAKRIPRELLTVSNEEQKTLSMAMMNLRSRFVYLSVIRKDSLSKEQDSNQESVKVPQTMWRKGWDSN